MALAIAGGIGLYVVVWLYGSHSEAFEFVDHTMHTSAAIHDRVGDVQEVHLGMFDGYSERFAGSERRAWMTVRVVGNRGTVKVKAYVRKSGGTWTVTDASVAGEHVSLN